VLTGSVNQACVEAGTSPLVKEMLCRADTGSLEMAPAADMFELGVRVQVLKHGTLFAGRARRLYELYRAHGGWEEIPACERDPIEARTFRRSFADVCREVDAYLEARDPAALAEVRRDPKRRMASAFKWYLHMASRWAMEGVRDRSVDFQIWCGPAMAAFNHWVQGSFLEEPSARTVVAVAMNLLHGAATLERARFLAMQGVSLPPAAFRVRPVRF
jgi:PfaD family protein